MIFWLNGAVSGVLLAERINGYLAFNWESFASQNYFDPHGVFIAVLWSGPLLLISMLIVVSVASSLSSTWASPPPLPLREPVSLSSGQHPPHVGQADHPVEEGGAAAPCQTRPREERVARVEMPPISCRNYESGLAGLSSFV